MGFIKSADRYSGACHLSCFERGFGVFSQPDVLALGEEADFEAQSFQPAQNLIRST